MSDDREALAELIGRALCEQLLVYTDPMWDPEEGMGHFLVDGNIDLLELADTILAAR